MLLHPLSTHSGLTKFSAGLASIVLVVIGLAVSLLGTDLAVGMMIGTTVSTLPKVIAISTLGLGFIVAGVVTWISVVLEFRI